MKTFGMNRNILKHIIRYILIICIIIWCSVIFNFSAEQGITSKSTSGRFSYFVLRIFDNVEEMSEIEIIQKIEIIQPFIRKLAHFFVYFVLGILTMSCAQTFKWCKAYKFDISVIFTFLYACTDEIHQLLVPARKGSFVDVCLDTVASAFGILLILLITSIIKKATDKNKSKPKALVEKNVDTGLKRKVLFIASTGGHLNELMQIKPLFQNFDYHIVTEKTKVDVSLKEEYGEKISFLIYGTKKHPLTYVFKFLANCFISLYYFFKYQPEVVITTGTHTAVPMCYIAKIFGSKVIFIETFANRITGTVAGKLIYPIADTFVVQWEEMHKIYPKSVCWGWIY